MKNRVVGVVQTAVVIWTLLVPAGAAYAVLIDFDTYPDNSPVPSGPNVFDQWASLGVKFFDAANNGPAFAVSSGCSLSAPNHVAGSVSATVVSVFVDPITGDPALTDSAGTAQDLCWAPGEGIDMRAYDINGNLLGQFFNAGPGSSFTFNYPEPIIARLEMDVVGQGIDNFTFNPPVPIQSTNGVIPEPSTLLLLSLGGGLGLGFRSRRQKRS
ncbi:MAG: PEP-CTERM sorting domain-containing protein [Candidatus Omnitrophica bacterium]|nr:PEP-CTERM sorting domain-containing protein [Candidatus Omnitrophota bacterium]